MGTKEVRAKWQSFKADPANHYSIATLRRMVDQAGHDSIAVCDAVEPQFGPVDAAAVVQSPIEGPRKPHLLDKYSLRGMLPELERNARDELAVLGKIALQGQATIFFAAPNTGKTLLMLHLLTESIRQQRIDPSRVFYLNVDDTHNGLIEKLRIAEEYGFNMLSDGYKGFTAKDLLPLLEKLSTQGDEEAGQ